MTKEQIKEKIKKDYPDFQRDLELVKKYFGEFKISGLKLEVVKDHEKA